MCARVCIEEHKENITRMTVCAMQSYVYVCSQVGQSAVHARRESMKSYE